MRIKAFGAACLLVGGLLTLGKPATAGAQDTSKEKFTVAADIGVRAFANQPNARELGKFEEYRDLPGNTPVPEHLLLKYTRDALSAFTLDTRKLFERDQSVFLQARRVGTYDLQLRWDRIPHTYSTTARSPGIEDVAGFNSLPAPRPDSMAWRNSPYIGAVRQQWDPIKASLAWTPNDKLDFKADYLRIGKSGGLPLSLSFSGSSGPQREFVSPVDQTVQDFRISQGFASGPGSEKGFLQSYQLMATYDYSIFRNSTKSTMVDNPQLAISSPTAGTSSGRASLAPDNGAHTVSVTGAVQLPVRTRVMGTFSESWMSQNDPFFPQASNDSLLSNPNYGLLALPRASLDGKVKTSVFNISANSHPIGNLTLSARYRNYDRTDNTAQFHIRAMAISDRSINLGDSLYSEIDPYTKANTDLNASYQLTRGLSVTGGYALENWTRDAETRNLAKTEEKGPRVSVDFTGLEWLTLHSSYTSTRRRGDNYAKAATELIDFRRFDLADRNRTRTNVLATVTPLRQISVSVNYGLGDDKFPNSQYGTQSDKATTKGFDVGFDDLKRFTISVGYSRDDATNVLNSRYRTGAAGTPTYDNPTYKWTNTNKDENTTTYASLTATVIPNRLDLMASVSNIDAHFWVNNFNPTTPTGGTATQNLAATVENWPEVTQNLKPIAVSLRYRYSPAWALTARFQREQYEQNDFRTASPLFAPFNSLTGNLPGSIGTVTGTNTGQYHFLSNAYQPYTASWFTLLVSYHPESLFRKARMTL
ncbi:MAG TPA: MtrB/PioB family outer membrane beta-barrel protein [Longimicrobiales bacterium]